MSLSPCDVPEESRSAKLIRQECENVCNLLLVKNARYGNSALEPVRVFSKANTKEQIKVRIDDKIKRIQNQSPEDDEDAVLDLIGYLVLLRIANKVSVNE